MKWSRGRFKFTLSEQDLEIMGQCEMPIDEVMGTGNIVNGLPPLWSVLSFEMLRLDGDKVSHIWEAYRKSGELEKHPEQHYRTAQMPKSTEGVRTLRVPDWELYCRQHFLLREIFSHIPVSGRAFAYRKGVGIRECAEPHVGCQVLIHMDIQDFFGSIREKKVFECLLRDTGYPKALAHFISRVCCCRGSLPQGACTSPILSNICFRGCDEELEALAKAYSLVYTRYSDDLYFSGSTTATGEIIGKVTAILQSHGFQVNREKTRVLGKNSAQRVLGLTVNERLQVSRDYRRQLRQELYYLHQFGTNAKGVKTAGGWYSYLHQLKGKLNYVLAMDPENEEFRSQRRLIHFMLEEPWY